MARILLVEPFHGGSHAAWATGLIQHSSHQVDAHTMPGRHWKWRMHGGAVTLAARFRQLARQPQVLLATDMLDLAVYKGLIGPQGNRLPTALYFHENQLTFPWSPSDPDVAQQRDRHYAFINYTSALAADRLFFNSHYHQDAFGAALEPFLHAFPDHRDLHHVPDLLAKSAVLPLGVDLRGLGGPAADERGDKPLILWNHRWEYDKHPELFFAALQAVAAQGIDFEVAVLGEQFGAYPPVFDEARAWLGERLVHWGFVADRAEYARWLWRADILPVTSGQDFFGSAAVEAMHCGAYPLLPNRLAFPEHVPQEHRAAMLYDNQEALVRKLIGAIGQWRTLSTRAVQEKVWRYDWSQVIPAYDRALEALIA
ncbi:MAG: DUF3524 domain-containing protein [Bacteroidota bacterium]